METLSSRLKTAEKINDYILEDVIETEIDFEDYVHNLDKKFSRFYNNNFVHFIGLKGVKLKIPLIETKDYQKEIFQDYMTNPVIQRALSGEKSVENSLRELGEVNQGIKRFLPKAKDETHNKKVAEMSHLIEGVEPLYTKRYFNLDNALTSAVGFGALSFGVLYGFSKLVMPELSIHPNPSEINQNLVMSEFLIPSIYLSVGGGLIAGAITSWDKVTYKPPINQARYIDDKIEEIFRS
jgi:hypothetical protein